jgi:hypothetical protein
VELVVLIDWRRLAAAQESHRCVQVNDMQRGEPILRDSIRVVVSLQCRHVGRDANESGAGSFLLEAHEGRFVNVDRDDGGLVVEEGLRRGAANAAGRASDERDSAGQSIRHAPRLQWP